MKIIEECKFPQKGPDTGYYETREVTFELDDCEDLVLSVKDKELIRINFDTLKKIVEAFDIFEEIE